MSDEAAELSALLGRLALRDRQALTTLYQATSHRLLAVADRLLRDRGAAEDVLQEVFIQLWSRAGQYPAVHAHPMAWLTATVRNRSIDVLRRKRPETPLQWRDADGEEHQHEVADERPGALEQLMAAQTDDQLGRCLGRLEEAPRQAVVLAYYEGLTHADLAQRLGHPLGTVKAWVRRSLLRLKLCMESGALA